MKYEFRKATAEDAAPIWAILEQAIVRRRQDGSEQWQDGYPNPAIVDNDIAKGAGFVMTINRDTIIGYFALFLNDEPAYEDIEGSWLTTGEFAAIHRIAVSADHLGKGLSKLILAYAEDFAKQHDIPSLKADTNFDNPAMLKTFLNAGFVYCGEVFLRGKPRKAFEKVLNT